MKNYIIIVFIFIFSLNINIHGQEYKAKGVKYEYDKLENIETYYTEGGIRPAVAGRLRIAHLKSGDKVIYFEVKFKTARIHDISHVDSIKFYNRDMDEALELEVVDNDFYIDTDAHGKFVALTTASMRPREDDIAILKNIMTKYKKVCARVYFDKNKYVDYLDKTTMTLTTTCAAVSGVPALLNLIDIYYKVSNMPADAKEQ